MNIYANRYKKLIDSFRDMIFEENDYFETHHIMPKCLGGSDDASNLIKLTAKAHYIAHLLLTKMYPNEPKIAYAFHMMACIKAGQENRKEFLTAARYDKLRKIRIGVGHTEETRQKMKGPRGKNKTYSEKKAKAAKENGRKAIAVIKGKPRSEEYLHNLKKSLNKPEVKMKRAKSIKEYWSEENRKKHSDRMKKAWAKKKEAVNG